MFIAKTPLGRAGLPGDIAAAVSFAVSDDAAWVTGSSVDVAGGLVFQCRSFGAA
ncbi:MAG TPA: SDR family oxidoreductase [Paraburkholderia sp.]|nr:SDR family oxidoreductase [Paraburkholderia sp.]